MNNPIRLNIKGKEWEDSFQEGYYLALKRVGAETSGKYYEDWKGSQSAKEQWKWDEEDRKIRCNSTPQFYATGISDAVPIGTKFVENVGWDLTGIYVPLINKENLFSETLNYNNFQIPRGCISSKWCNNCFTEHHSGTCVCGTWSCSKCGGGLSLEKIEGQEYTRERH